jgi:hypothetical protein
LWRNEYERPLAMEDKLGITVSPIEKANSSPW